MAKSVRGDDTGCATGERAAKRAKPLADEPAGGGAGSSAEPDSAPSSAGGSGVEELARADSIAPSDLGVTPETDAPGHEFMAREEEEQLEEGSRTAWETAARKKAAARAIEKEKAEKKEKKIKKPVKRLHALLEKSIVYSEFLATKLKNPNAEFGVAAERGAAAAAPAAAPVAAAAGGAGGVGQTEGIVSSGVGWLAQPQAVTGGVMRDYQLVGVHWLTGLYENGLNGILGDEMGLGKTIQTIGFLAFLRERGTHGPFLIVGPLSTIGHWKNEFEKWAPGIPTLLYHGSKEERLQLRSEHMRFPNSERFPVVVASYEIVSRDIKELRRYGWKYLVVDQRHEPKKLNCMLLQRVKNDLTELWSLLNFVLPNIFYSFRSWFDFNLHAEDHQSKILQAEEEAGVVSKLHLILKPFLLRRLKADVDLTIPPKHEYVLYCDLSAEQRATYASILEKELVTSHDAVRLINILMQLRKCCNHPYLFDRPTDEAGANVIDEGIVAASGKMQLLDRIMTRLRAEGGHQVLIFSQMTTQLDILADYCKLRGFSYERLDGSVPAAKRPAAMQRFNAGGVDVFLLSTRAGGLGINLVAADTVILYDSSLNPQMDLQAQERCHRIGQTSAVLVLRLATADTVEEMVMKRAKDKLRLEHLVIAKGKYKMVGEKTNRDETIRKNELQKLLAYDPAKATLGSNPTHTISDAELALVLDRSATAADGAPAGGRSFVPVEAVVSKFDMESKEADRAIQPQPEHAHHDADRAIQPQPGHAHHDADRAISPQPGHAHHDADRAISPQPGHAHHDADRANEYVLYCDMSKQQQQMYGRGLGRGLAQMRQCCNHPFICNWPTDEGGSGGKSKRVDESLVQASGKMQLLDRIMPKLLEDGCQVLIFSGMTKQLDILAEYCELRDFSYEKIDSCLFGSELESAVRRFDEGKVGVCLFWTLHTGMMGGKRAGKDTCIFYESGINEPQVETDLVLRLVTENTIEDREMKNPNKRIRQVRSASTISDAELARILDGSGKAAESGAGSAR